MFIYSLISILYYGGNLQKSLLWRGEKLLTSYKKYPSLLWWGIRLCYEGVSVFVMKGYPSLLWRGWLDFSTLLYIVPLFKMIINKQDLTKKISLLELFFVVVRASILDKIYLLIWNHKVKRLKRWFLAL